MQMLSDAHSFGHKCYYIMDNSRIVTNHRSHYIGTLLDCDVCHEHRKKMKADWSKEGIERKFVKS